jgi:hypothetical protein
VRSDEMALVRLEIRRRVFSWRFVVVMAVMSFIAWSITNQMTAFGSATGVPYNAWDVFLGVFGGTANMFPAPVLFPLLFVFLLGSSVQEDVLSGYSLVAQARLVRKNAYWWVKVLAILAVVAIVIASLYAVSLLLGIVRGFGVVPATLSPAGGNPNAWGMTHGVPPVYYSLPRRANVVVHGLAAALYLVFAYFAVVMFVVGLTVRSKNLYVPLALTALLTTSQLAIAAHAAGFLLEYNLVSALTESAHRVIPVLDPHQTFVPWSSSLLLLSALLLIGLVAGALMTPTRMTGDRAGKRALESLRRIFVSAILTLCLLVAAALLGGCSSAGPTRLSYKQFYSDAEPPPPPAVPIGKLSPDDIGYLRALSHDTVRLAAAWDDVAETLGPSDLHLSDSALSVLLARRLSAVEGDLRDIRALKPTRALARWYRVEYAPGLAELDGVAKNLGPLCAKRDWVAVRMCLKRADCANVYFSAAGQAIAPFAPKQ